MELCVLGALVYPRAEGGAGVSAATFKTDKDGNIRCRVCSCTHFEPCNPPCAWFEEDLCTTCALIVEAIESWKDQAHHPSMAALKRELDRRFDELWAARRSAR